MCFLKLSDVAFQWREKTHVVVTVWKVEFGHADSWRNQVGYFSIFGGGFEWIGIGNYGQEKNRVLGQKKTERRQIFVGHVWYPLQKQQ